MQLLVLSAVLALACAQDATTAAPKFDMQGSFDMADADSNGYITRAELIELVTKFDDNRDGMVNASEFVSHYMKTGMSVSGSLYVFFRIDQNHNQIVEKTEAEPLFRSFDVTRDNKVDIMEYSEAMMKVMMDLMTAAAIGEKLEGLVSTADANKDDYLSGAELWAVVSGAGTDSNGLISKMDFVTFWMRETNSSKDMSSRLFDIFDGDHDGKFGQEAERKAVYASFDYNNDTALSREEFMNSMLYLFSLITEAQENALMEAMMMDSKFDADATFQAADANNDDMLDMAEVKAKYAKFDDDGNGLINTTEFLKHSAATGMSDQGSLFILFKIDMDEDYSISDKEIEMEFRHKLDRNMDGKVTKEEYMHAVAGLHYQLKRASEMGVRLGRAFSEKDMNKDGKLSKDEMFGKSYGAGVNASSFITKFKFAAGASDNVAGAFFKVMDLDKNGKLEKGEFDLIYDGFDYEKDGMVTKSEYLNSMLNIYSKATDLLTKEIRMKLQGSYNATVAFMAALNGKGDTIKFDDYKAGLMTADTDMNKEVSIEEFIRSYVQTGMAPKGAQYVFHLLDGNDDNKMDESEVKTAFSNADLDGNGEVTLSEYKTVMKMVVFQMQEASLAGFMLGTFFDHVDLNLDHFLSKEEATGMLMAFDKNKDGLASEAEFVPMWQYISGEPKDRSAMMFGILDEDDDGFFGNDNERQAFFDGFDYDDDDAISKDEFLSSMLFLYARIIKQMAAVAA